MYLQKPHIALILTFTLAASHNQYGPGLLLVFARFHAGLMAHVKFNGKAAALCNGIKLVVRGLKLLQNLSKRSVFPNGKCPCLA